MPPTSAPDAEHAIASRGRGAVTHGHHLIHPIFAVTTVGCSIYYLTMPLKDATGTCSIFNLQKRKGKREKKEGKTKYPVSRLITPVSPPLPAHVVISSNQTPQQNKRPNSN